MTDTRADLGFHHRFVPAPGNSARTLILLHGTGGNEDDLLPLGRQLDPEAALLSPRGNVLERGMPRFFRRLAEGVFDEDDVRFRAAELSRFIAAAAAHYGFDAGGAVAVGFSNGANVAAAMLLLEPVGLLGGVLLRPMVPLVPPVTRSLAGVGVLIRAGRTDPIATPAQAEALADLLGGSGAAVTLEWENAGHELTLSDRDSAARWLGALPAARIR